MLKAPFFFWHHPPGAHLVSACASPGQGCRAPEQPTWSDELTPRLAGWPAAAAVGLDSRGRRVVK